MEFNQEAESQKDWGLIEISHWSSRGPKRFHSTFPIAVYMRLWRWKRFLERSKRKELKEWRERTEAHLFNMARTVSINSSWLQIWISIFIISQFLLVFTFRSASISLHRLSRANKGRKLAAICLLKSNIWRATRMKEAMQTWRRTFCIEQKNSYFLLDISFYCLVRFNSEGSLQFSS